LGQQFLADRAAVKLRHAQIAIEADARHKGVAGCGVYLSRQF
jgi:hypothetical protein